MTALTCGDTASDIPLIEASPGTAVIFITHDEGFKERVRAIVPDAVFVSHPDTLIAILARLAGERQ